MSDKYDLRIQVRMGQPTKDRLDELCEETGLDASSVVRMLIHERHTAGPNGPAFVRAEIEKLRSSRV